MKAASHSNGRTIRASRQPKMPRVSLASIKAFADEVVRRYKPEKIILFGSWAYGKPNVESDVDLLIIMPFKGSPFRQAGEILNGVIQTVGVLPMDLLVRTSGQLRERLKMGDGFTRNILERGKVLYEADRA